MRSPAATPVIRSCLLRRSATVVAHQAAAAAQLDHPACVLGREDDLQPVQIIVLVSDLAVVLGVVVTVDVAHERLAPGHELGHRERGLLALRPGEPIDGIDLVRGRVVVVSLGVTLADELRARADDAAAARIDMLEIQMTRGQFGRGRGVQVLDGGIEEPRFVGVGHHQPFGGDDEAIDAVEVVDVAEHGAVSFGRGRVLLCKTGCLTL